MTDEPLREIGTVDHVESVGMGEHPVVEHSTDGSQNDVGEIPLPARRVGQIVRMRLRTPKILRARSIKSRSR